MPTPRLTKFFGKEFKIESLEKIWKTTDAFSITEKIVFALCGVILIISVAVMLFKVNKAVSVLVPAPGGELTEGVIGTPRFINPLLALSDADRDLTSLVYSGLLKATPNGNLIPDLAESYTISESGLEYDIVLKDGITFQDGQSVTADDVIFTIQKAQDPTLKSPRRPNWEGISVEKISDKEIKIFLRQPYAPFLENLTVGIVPKHIWKDVSSEQFPFSQFNIEPIGSGPYKITSIQRNSGGIPTAYTLSSFKDYALGAPYIYTLTIQFYSNDKDLLDAYQGGNIESLNGIEPQRAEALKNIGANVINVPLPRIFGVFFNQNQATEFTQSEVRTALNKSIDRDRIVREVLRGYGTTILGPLPPSTPKSGDLQNSEMRTREEANATSTESVGMENAVTEAKNLLQKNGWKTNPQTGILEKKVKNETYKLAFSISTSNAPELKAIAEIVKENWEKIGAQVEIKIFEVGDLNQSVIRPRKYDALLFGEIIGRDMDLFSFWHSSQRNDPGLNIALYTNSKVDKILEEVRATTDPAKREEKYRAFEIEIQKDTPAIFLYSPDFIYLLPSKIQGVVPGLVTIPSERFLDIEHWYINTDSIWKIFVKK